MHPYFNCECYLDIFASADPDVWKKISQCTQSDISGNQAHFHKEHQNNVNICDFGRPLMVYQYF